MLSITVICLKLRVIDSVNWALPPPLWLTEVTTGYCSRMVMLLRGSGAPITGGVVVIPMASVGPRGVPLREKRLVSSCLLVASASFSRFRLLTRAAPLEDPLAAIAGEVTPNENEWISLASPAAQF